MVKRFLYSTRILILKMATVGSVEDYEELRGLPLPPNPGSFDIVLIRQQKGSIYPIPLTSPPNGGIFVWDKNTDEADDGGTIIAPGGGDSRTMEAAVRRYPFSQVVWCKGGYKGNFGAL